MSSRFMKPRIGPGEEADPTRFLYLSGVGAGLGTNPNDLVDLFRKFGDLDDEPIEMIEDKRYCFIIYKDVQSAIIAKKELGDRNIESMENIKFVIKYAHERVYHGMPEPEECMHYKEVNLPGLSFYEEFITSTDEQALLNSICADTYPLWEMALNRRVQHYGFSFNYRSLLLDYTADTPPIPSDLSPLVSRIQDMANTAAGGSTYPINQLTMNEYEPTQGIASHTDATTCFGPVICILSLGNPTVMTFTDKRSLLNKDNSSSNSSIDLEELKKLQTHVLIPPRSLMIFTDSVRYEFTHGIASRRTDKVEGKKVERERRVSLTFRQAIIPGGVPGPALKPTALEKDHVFDVYDSIAVHWNHTRGKRKVHWHSVKDFLMSLPVGTILADVGCGDGKYFGVNPGVTIIGCDRSWNLLQVSQDPNYDTFCCDAVSLPFQSGVFDAVLCIAVLHHISTLDRRVAIIRELVRITRNGGEILLQAWAQEQENIKGRTFDFESSETQDVFVPWTLPTRFQATSNAAESGGDSGQGEKQKEDTVDTIHTVKREPNKRATSSVRENEDSKRSVIRSREEKRRKRAEKKRLKAIERRQQREGQQTVVNQDSTTNDDINETIKEEADDDDDGDDVVERKVEKTSESTVELSQLSLVSNHDSQQNESTLNDTILNKTECNNLIKKENHDIPNVTTDNGSSSNLQSHIQSTTNKVLHRYCHVYKKGELEDLCSSVPHCRIIESGYDKGNWFVRLQKIEDVRLRNAFVGSPASLPVIVPRTHIVTTGNGSHS